MFVEQRLNLIGWGDDLGNFHPGGETQVFQGLGGEWVGQGHGQSGGVARDRQGPQIAGGVRGDPREQFGAEVEPGEIRNQGQT